MRFLKFQKTWWVEFFWFFAWSYNSMKAENWAKLFLQNPWIQTEPKMKHFSFVENWKVVVHFFNEIAAAWRSKIALNNLLLLLLFIYFFFFFCKGWGDLVFGFSVRKSVKFWVEHAFSCCKFVELSKEPLQLKTLIVSETSFGKHFCSAINFLL